MNYMNKDINSLYPFSFINPSTKYSMRDNRGRPHCRKGPAVIYSTGEKRYYLHGTLYHYREDFQRDAKLSNQDMAMIVLKYGKEGLKEG